MKFLRSKTGLSIIGLVGIFIFGGFVSGVFGGTVFNLTLNSNKDLENGLVGHWTFDSSDVSGFTVSDSSGSGNDGVLIATTTGSGVEVSTPYRPASAKAEWPRCRGG